MAKFVVVDIARQGKYPNDIGQVRFRALDAVPGERSWAELLVDPEFSLTLNSSPLLTEMRNGDVFDIGLEKAPTQDFE